MWYHDVVIGYLVSLALINSSTVWQQIGRTESLLDFQLEVCHCLLKADQQIESDEYVTNPFSQSRSLSINQVPMPVCHDRVNQWPIKCEKVNLCKQRGSIKRTHFKCSKYQVCLCVLSDCSINFHGVEKSLEKCCLYADFAGDYGFVFHFPINLY